MPYENEIFLLSLSYIAGGGAHLQYMITKVGIFVFNKNLKITGIFFIVSWLPPGVTKSLVDRTCNLMLMLMLMLSSQISISGFMG